MGLSYDTLPPHIKRLAAQAGYQKGQAPHQVKRAGVMNEHEKKFYRDYIAPRELTGELTDVQYEAARFQLAHRTTYCPDFVARAGSAQLVAFEIKAPHRFRDKGVIKLKVAATMYPGVIFHLCELKNKSWQVKPIPRLKAQVELPPLDEDDE